MSLLSSFQDDFNRIITIYSNTANKSGSWFVSDDYSIIADDIKCLILKNSNKYSEKIDDKVEILQTTHKVRLNFWIDIKEDYKIVDNLQNSYIIKFVENCPGFWWSDDHLVLYVNKQKWVE